MIAVCGRVMSALANESQSACDDIGLERLRLHATDAGAASWSRTLLEFWRARQERSLLILEGANSIADDPEALSLIEDMLAGRPMERTLLITSTTPLPLRVAHYLAPHQVLTFSLEELRLDDGEAEGNFEGTDLAPSAVRRIVGLAAGWPAALSLLARIAHYEPNIDAFIERVNDVGSEGLHDYLLREVLKALTPEMTSALLAVAAIPNASLEDVAAATGIAYATPVLQSLLRLPGFVTSERGIYQTHPLLLRALRERHAVALADCVLRAARETERFGDYLRAAELYNTLPDARAAAAALDRLPPERLSGPSMRLVDALAEIPISTVCALPNLWIATLQYRRQNVDGARLREEALDLTRRAADAQPGLRRRLGVRLAGIALELGRVREARSVLEELAPAARSEETPAERRLFLMTSAIVAAKQGRFADAERLVEAADALQAARHLRFEAERVQIAFQKARFRGDWQEALKISEEMLTAARRDRSTTSIVEAARLVARAAWFANDDDRVSTAQQLLRDCGDDEESTIARSVDALAAGEAAELPKRFTPIASWRAAFASADPAQAQELLDRAIAGIDEYDDDLLRVLVRVSAALLLDSARARLHEARAIAACVESAPMQASIELLIEAREPGECGIFWQIAVRAARSPLNRQRDRLSLLVTRGELRRGITTLHVSDRGLELLIALALLPAGTPKETIAEAIWPSLDGKSALNALKMCVSRTRAQINDREVIQNSRNGYALSEQVGIDVRDFERLLRRIRGAAAMGETARRQASQAASALMGRDCGYASAWAWFRPYAIHLDELQRELAGVAHEGNGHSERSTA